MKKIMAIILILILVVSISGCTASGNSQSNNIKHETNNAVSTSNNYQNNTSSNTASTKKECSHNWKAATCASAKKCTICGKTEGNALNHKYSEATCKDLAKCEYCGETKGSLANHKKNSQGMCAFCGKDLFLDNIKENLDVKLIVPSVGASNNYYCQVSFSNHTGEDVTLSMHVYANGKGCGNLQAANYVIESGYKTTGSFYRSTTIGDRLNDKYKDMYLDNSSQAWTVLQISGKKVYVKFGTTGITKIGYNASDIDEY